MDNENNNINIIDYCFKNIKYFKSLYNLIFLYINELKEIKVNLDINESLDQNIIKNIIKKLENYINLINIDNLTYKLDNKKKHKEIINLLKIIKLNTKLNNLVKIHIQFINEIDIYDRKILMSDTSKNNINKNKLHILDIYNNIITNINNNLKIIINDSVYLIKKMILSENIQNTNYNITDIILFVDIINNYFNKHINIIQFFIIFEQSLLNINNILDDYLFIINENNKQFALQYDLNKLDITGNIKNNISLSFNTEKLKNKYIILKNNNNIVKTFNKFKFTSTFDSLDKLLLSANINIKVSNNINKDTINILEKACKLYEKKYKHNIIIVILECKLDPILYDITKLVDNTIKVDKLSGINDNYINKTNTIIESNNNKNLNIYISNIQKTHIINSSINYNLKSNIIDINYNTYNCKTLLIHTYNNTNFTLLYNDVNTNFTILFKEILPLIQNQPNYNIENYNTIIENNILNNIENKNILDEYYKTIKLDVNTYNLENTREIKNNIINDIINKINLKFNYENKNLIIHQILNIIIDNISKYIKNKNKIEYDAETYMTYLSNVNSLINKFKKEVVDNYDDNFIDNIDNIIENIYNKILKINDNIIDKYYYTHII